MGLLLRILCLLMTNIISQKLEIISPLDMIETFGNGIKFSIGNIGHVPYG